MLRLGPLQVKVRKGLGTEGASPGMGTDLMASLTCVHHTPSNPCPWSHLQEGRESARLQSAAWGMPHAVSLDDTNRSMCCMGQKVCSMHQQHRQPCAPPSSRHRWHQQPGGLCEGGRAQIGMRSGSGAGCRMCRCSAQTGHPVVSKMGSHHLKDALQVSSGTKYPAGGYTAHIALGMASDME